MSSSPVQTGLDVLRQDGFSGLRGRRLGLLVHPASVAGDLTHLIDLTAEAGLDVRVLFEPEHGVSGSAQDMQPVEDGGTVRGIPRISLYGSDPASLLPPPDALDDIDVLLVDLQDMGSRYYTFAVTMRYCLEACAQARVMVLVADRPNPINGIAVEGPMLHDDRRSFVGGYRVPVRHGLTIGELARLAGSQLQVELEVVHMRGWERSMWFNQTGLPWVLPSPNMPSLDSATVYPGSCLIESTNLSEGRGSTRPFELIGAPWLDAVAWVGELRARKIAGVAFRKASFTPTFQKHAGELCHGVQLHVTNRDEFRPFRCGLHLLESAIRQSGEKFRWRSDPYEFVSDIPAIDLLAGTSAVRETLENRGSLDDLERSWRDEIDEFEDSRRSVLLYQNREGS